MSSTNESLTKNSAFPFAVSYSLTHFICCLWCQNVFTTTERTKKNRIGTIRKAKKWMYLKPFFVQNKIFTLFCLSIYSYQSCHSIWCIRLFQWVFFVVFYLDLWINIKTNNTCSRYGIFKCFSVRKSCWSIFSAMYKMSLMDISYETQTHWS